MSDNDRLRHALEAPFPDHAIKQRQGGGNSRFSYIEGFTIIRRLNEATGGTWDWAIKSFEFRPLPPDQDGNSRSNPWSS
jgi:recombination DNA repair RAD52 pathway protein